MERKMGKPGSGGIFFVGLTFFLLGVLMVIAPASKNLSFSWNCEEYLKRAADSASPEKCGEQLDLALKYAKENGLTTGNTGIIWNTPKNDLSFWYENLEKAREALKEVENSGSESKTTALERSNVLIRVRETLLDGVNVTCPDSISFFPNVLFMHILLWIGIIFSFIGAIVVLASLSPDRK
jgi:hypothetical protein